MWATEWRRNNNTCSHVWPHQYAQLRRLCPTLGGQLFLIHRFKRINKRYDWQLQFPYNLYILDTKEISWSHFFYFLAGWRGNQYFCFLTEFVLLGLLSVKLALISIASLWCCWYNLIIYSYYDLCMPIRSQIVVPVVLVLRLNINLLTYQH